MEKKPKILLVDDDINLRAMYAEIFENENFEVLQADDGLDGLDIASKEVPDIIFTGIVMPRMDGFTMIEALKKAVVTANIPVVISSHMGREEDQQRANLLGAKDFIMKGVVTPKEVVNRVKSFLIKEGGEYKIDFNPSSLDAQKLAKDMNFQDTFICPNCNEKIAFNLKLLDAKERKFEARFVCSKCGWEAK